MTTFFFRRDSRSAAQSPVTRIRTGHVYLDVRRRKLHCLNETARDMLREGVPLTPEALGRQPLRSLADEEVTADDLPLVRAWRQRVPVEATFVLARPGLAVQHLTVSAAPLAGEDGAVVGVTAAAMLAAPEPDWQELAGLSHDLRTPLQAIRLLLALLPGLPGVPGEAGDLLDRLRTSAERALAVSMDLLEWCRGPAQASRRVSRDWFPLVPLLRDLTREHAASARHKGIRLDTDLAAAEGVEICSDRVGLGRLLSNLLTNAVRYTPAGQVRLAASWRPTLDGPGRTLVLAVRDTGAGIDTEDQESIFQPYERGRAGREGDSSGSGLGLSVVDRLVHELGLAVEVSSEYGRGSTFELLLPPSCLRPLTPA